MKISNKEEEYHQKAVYPLHLENSSVTQSLIDEVYKQELSKYVKSKTDMVMNKKILS